MPSRGYRVPQLVTTYAGSVEMPVRRAAADLPPPVWAQLVAAAARVRSRCRDSDLTISAERRRRIGRTVEGLAAWDEGTNMWEPVRERRWFGGSWTQLQTVGEAEVGTEWFLRERPDLRAAGDCH